MRENVHSECETVISLTRSWDSRWNYETWQVCLMDIFYWIIMKLHQNC